MKNNLAIFASGSGTNAENIIRYFRGNSDTEIKLVLSNNAEAYVLERAKKLAVPTFVFSKADFEKTDRVLTVLRENNIHWIILAGFLWLVPRSLVEAYPSRIINIHPALLPKFGGKGMYGERVHRAVIEAGQTTSGITIHLINDKYDEGLVLFQATCPVEKEDTATTLAAKIHELEYVHFPEVIRNIVIQRGN